MAKRSLAEEMFGVLSSCEGVTRVRNTGIVPGSGKKKVKIVRGSGEVTLMVTEPDYSKKLITADTKDVVTTAWQVEQFLKRERVECVNK
jgi:hypothetical protein